MRTALVLLFALALAAIPGSLVPQRKISPVRVSEFITAHPTLGPIYDRVGMFGVYTSPWFSAIYLLLFVSLVGCIIPRVGVYGARRPGPAPQDPAEPRPTARVRDGRTADRRRLGRWRDVLDRAAEILRAQRYRVDRHESSVAAERGYLREAGNLVFHISLLFVLLGVAIGGLWGFRGTSVVIVGQGFSNNLTQYDDFSAGAEFTDSDLQPFSVMVKNFDVKFETGPVQRGAARLFRADVEVTDRPGAQPHAETLEVNKPLHIDGTTVHLIGHGYAPKVTVKDAQGNVAFSGPVVMLPQDGNFTSVGAIKAPDARPERLAFEAFFYPTAVRRRAAGPQSVFPDALNPALFLNVWYGPPKVETGKPENVYSLDPTGLTQLQASDGQPVRYRPQRRRRRQPARRPGLDPAGRLVPLGQAADRRHPRCADLARSRSGSPWPGCACRCSSGPGGCGFGSAATREAGPRVVEVGGLDRADARAGLTEDVAELARRAVPPAQGSEQRRELRVLLQPGAGHLGGGLRCWPCSRTPRSGPAARRPARD